MMQITTPDIGVDKATVAEILVKVGDTIAVDDSIVLLESDKASVEVPSTSAGVVKRIAVTEGDEVSEGAVLIEVESADATATEAAEAPAQEPAKAEPVAEVKAESVAPVANSASANVASQTVEVQVPDIGVEKALVGEVLVKAGDEIAVDDSIVVVESDKATVEVPSTVAGIVESVAVKEGDSVKEGVLLITVKTAGDSAASTTPSTEASQQTTTASAQAPAQEQPAVTQSGQVEVTVPDLGVDKATISEILVNVGDRVEKDQSLCVAESDKASVEVPSTVAGVAVSYTHLTLPTICSV